MRTFFRTMVIAGSALLLSSQLGCAKRGKGLTKVDQEMLKEHILDDMPADVTHKVDVNFEDKIHLIGWKADPEVATPGSTVHFTLYWKRTGDLDAGWKLFTHVTTDDVHASVGNLDCVGSIRQEKAANCAAQLYPPSEWEKGKVIKDSFEFTVPPADDLRKKSPTTLTSLRFLVGVWKDDTRLHIKNADANDGTDRANVITLPTGLQPAEPAPEPKKTEVPKLVAPKFGKNDVKLDGKMDEKFWDTAGSTGPFVSPGDGKSVPAHPVSATAKVGWTDDALIVGVQVDDKDPTSPFKAGDKDPHIWEKSSAVELMVQPGDPGDNKDYFEIQVDVNGAVFDTRWDDYNQPITGGPDEASKVFGHMDWASNLKQAVSIDKGKGYTIEIAIPWTSFKSAREGINVPPKPGDTWRVDFYSFRDGQKQALAWSPIMGQGNFHKSARFGKIIFAGVGGALPAASASASASAAPSGSTNVIPPVVAPKLGGPHSELKLAPKQPK